MRPMARIEAEMAQYPETGIVNPYIGTKLCLTQEMIDFFNGYLLEYKDYPDAKIAREFADKFEFTKDGAKEIEHAYVVVNRERIFKRIKNLHKRGNTTEAIVKQIQTDFGLNEVNAEKYVRRCMMDGLDNVGGCLIQEENTKPMTRIKTGKKKYSPNNIWNREGFRMCGLGEKNQFWARIKHIKRCIRWSYQRIARGYSDYDRWEMFYFLQHLLPEMLQDMRENGSGAPGYLGENYTNENGILGNDTCHEEWDEILDRMIFLWRELDEDTCSKKNPYEEEYDKAYGEFEEKYGLFGKELQTRGEREEMMGPDRMITVHFMDELPEYKEISDKYFEEKRNIEDYRNKCKDEAFDLLKEHFWALWD